MNSFMSLRRHQIRFIMATLTDKKINTGSPPYTLSSSCSTINLQGHTDIRTLQAATLLLIMPRHIISSRAFHDLLMQQRATP